MWDEEPTQRCVWIVRMAQLSTRLPRLLYHAKLAAGQATFATG
ncbi:hypothetical protein SPMU_27170 [Sphingomonas mucosissima]|uniref:Uncharacterized protein n=1 Tax=Sphingomonas mucosissima TaxID=370959 RepID=A0A245ZHI2_9SPHN|nr:hypothetical protein SPMU_27170 [Sphingomonas mucosissima]